LGIDSRYNSNQLKLKDQVSQEIHVNVIVNQLRMLLLRVVMVVELEVGMKISIRAEGRRGTKETELHEILLTILSLYF